MAMTRLDTTHPPTAYRIQVLEAYRVEHPQVALSAADSASIDAELARLKGQVQGKLVEGYRASLYHRYY